jgi:serine/threonine protein phosphatase PrpC
MTPYETYRSRGPEPAPLAADSPRLTAFARTHRGRRTRNQDAFLVADLSAGRIGLSPEVATHALGERGSLLVVSDGAGDDGEAASELAVTAFHRILGVVPDTVPPVERLARVAHYTAEYLYKYFLRRPVASDGGATMTAALVLGGVAYVAHVGDSRAYLLRDGVVRQITKDQTLSQALVDSGAIAADRSTSRPPHMLLQTLGRDPRVRADLTTVDLREGDTLLLCTDGLSNVVEPDEMLAATREHRDPALACRILVDLAAARGGENATVVIAHLDGMPRDLAEDEAVTWTMPEPGSAGPA